ncbi:hypothetical protein DXT87_12870 [Arthrobacter sp. AET 35A]|nr:hypothetical protein [Arthrobacter sp. AET 35A]
MDVSPDDSEPASADSLDLSAAVSGGAPSEVSAAASEEVSVDVSTDDPRHASAVPLSEAESAPDPGGITGPVEEASLPFIPLFDHPPLTVMMKLVVLRCDSATD